MLKYGNEVGLSPIAHIETKSLPDKAIRRFYKINQILYDNAKRYISPKMGERLLVELQASSLEFKEIEVDVLCQDLKEQILGILRKKYKQLKEYVKTFRWSKEDKECIAKTIKYQLSSYLKDKDSVDIEKTLQRNREVWEELYLPYPYHDSIDVKQFKRMQTELLERLIEPYKLSA
jgi:hypothetical protein